MHRDTKRTEIQNTQRHKCTETQNAQRHKMHRDAKRTETQNLLTVVSFVHFTYSKARLLWTKVAYIEGSHGTKITWSYTTVWNKQLKFITKLQALGTHGYLCVTYTVILTFCDEYSRQMQQIKSIDFVHYYFVLCYFGVVVMTFTIHVCCRCSKGFAKNKTGTVECPNDCLDIPNFNFNRIKITKFILTLWHLTTYIWVVPHL